jgi:hypothetical protein
MPGVIRYVRNSSRVPNVDIDVSSTGWDYQLIAFDITLSAGIAAGAQAVILTLEGSGEIKSVQTVFIRNPQTGEVIPMGAVAQNTPTIRTTDASRKP